MPVLPSTPTYRFTFSVAAGGAGAVIEIIGAASKLIRVREVKIVKPSAGVTISFAKRSAVATGGTTTTAPTVVPTDSTVDAFPGNVKAYTGAPTAGTLVGKVDEVAMGTGDVYVYDPGNDPERPITLRSATQVLTIDTSGAATVAGTVEVTVEDA